MDIGLLTKLEYLTACINESLRLHPVVPSGVQRITPPQGLQIGTTFVPGETIVQVPTYTLHRGKGEAVIGMYDERREVFPY